MKNLDNSITNQNILDDSFSNVVGAVNLSSGTPMRPTSGNVAVAVRPLEPKVSAATLVAPSVINAPKETPVSEAPQAQSTPVQPIIFGGGGGGGGYPSQESTESEATSREASGEKLIFGVKSQYVYGLAAIGALAFVYFKFIKK